MDDFDVSDFETEDTAEMVVQHPLTGDPTTWVWTFAGPSHPKGIEQANKSARKRLKEQQEIERSQINGKKWKPEQRTPDEVREENVRWVVDRVIGWTPIKINGELLEFSEAGAVKLLLNPKYGKLYQQAFDFLIGETSFTKRSAVKS